MRQQLHPVQDGFPRGAQRHQLHQRRHHRCHHRRHRCRPGGPIRRGEIGDELGQAAPHQHRAESRDHRRALPRERRVASRRPRESDSCPSSRKATVRYKLGFDKYVTEHSYSDVAALVAFSGEVTDTESGTNDPFTETTMNPGLKGRDLRDALATDEFQVMLVANKFQTGFDQPKLVAMYVDKKLGGVQAVQTLSRLNRTFAPLKDQTFVLDFANEVSDVVESFSPYYEVTTLADLTDANIVHNTERKLAVLGIYEGSEVDGLVVDYLAKKGNSALEKWIAPAAQRYTVRMQEAADASDKVAMDELTMFRKDAGTYVRQYEFLSQLFDYESPWLEKLAIYLKLLIVGGEARTPRENNRPTRRTESVTPYPVALPFQSRPVLSTVNVGRGGQELSGDLLHCGCPSLNASLLRSGGVEASHTLAYTSDTSGHTLRRPSSTDSTAAARSPYKTNSWGMTRPAESRRPRGSEIRNATQPSCRRHAVGSSRRSPKARS
ncbi:type I restriction enzyme subunit R domain-containing protein [Rhodococcoides kroppenstedtii]|uniref:type I restriction enzyme subunit R domain-containing protein n=1 Tax=Rhodococcoides kroppenstedtii TaxID=293050 RepID=UPI0031FCD1C9